MGNYRLLKKYFYTIITLIIIIFIIAGCKKQFKNDNYENLDEFKDTQQFPNKSIQIVIPYAPGGGSDNVARALSVTANKYFPQPIVPVNKLGESGARGLKEGLYAKNDGYTVTLITTETNSLSAFGLLDLDYTDIEPLILLNTEPGLVVTSKNFPYDTFDELIENIKSNNEIYSIGSAGKGSIWDLAAKGIEKETGVQFNSKYYDGTSLAVVDVLGGKLDIVIAGTSEVDEHLESGEMKLLTVLADEPLKGYEDVSTFKELGYNFSIYTWRGLAIPKGVDKEVKDILLEGFTKAAKDEEFILLMSQLGLNYDFREQKEFIDFLKKDLEFYNNLKEHLKNTEK